MLFCRGLRVRPGTERLHALGVTGRRHCEGHVAGHRRAPGAGVDDGHDGGGRSARRLPVYSSSSRLAAAADRVGDGFRHRGEVGVTAVGGGHRVGRRRGQEDAPCPPCTARHPPLRTCWSIVHDTELPSRPVIVHVTDPVILVLPTLFGVTAALNMAIWPLKIVSRLRRDRHGRRGPVPAAKAGVATHTPATTMARHVALSRVFTTVTPQS